MHRDETDIKPIKPDSQNVWVFLKNTDSFRIYLSWLVYHITEVPEFSVLCKFCSNNCACFSLKCYEVELNRLIVTLITHLAATGLAYESYGCSLHPPPIFLIPHGRRATVKKNPPLYSQQFKLKVTFLDRCCIFKCSVCLFHLLSS